MYDDVIQSFLLIFLALIEHNNIMLGDLELLALQYIAAHWNELSTAIPSSSVL